MWEANNALTNFDPATRTMVTAKDGSIADRALVDPDRNNFGPRLGFAYTVTPKTVHPRRLGHQLRPHQPHRLGEPAADQRAAGRSRGRSSRATRPRRRSGRRSRAIPAGLTDPSTFNPLTAQRQLHPEGLPLEPRAELVRLGAARVRSEMLLDVAYVGNKADDLLLVANYNQAAPNNAGGDHPAAGAAADPDLRRHHLRLQRRQVALQGACR